MGQFAERMLAELDLDLVAVDQSPRMVELARDRGVDACVGDAQELEFDDGRFDCVVANWMLYHVDDLDLALAEFARVLVPGGRLVAATIGEQHMHDVWSLTGFVPPQRQFSKENGEEALRRHFVRVERVDVNAILVFPDVASIHDYIDSTFFSATVPRPLPEPDVPFRSRTVNAVFVAEKAA
jgi:SAM-dependent methyltransferase